MDGWHVGLATFACFGDGVWDIAGLKGRMVLGILYVFAGGVVCRIFYSRLLRNSAWGFTRLLVGRMVHSALHTCLQEG